MIEIVGYRARLGQASSNLLPRSVSPLSSVELLHTCLTCGPSANSHLRSFASIDKRPKGTDVATRHRTVDRVVAILEFLAAHSQGAGLAELAAVLEAPKSSVHGLVQGLIATGYVIESDGSLILGPAIEALVTTSRLPTLTIAARKPLEALCQATGETAILGTRVGNSVMYLDHVPSPQLIRYAPELRQRRPLFVTSMGKVFLADISDRQLDRLLTSQEGIDRERLLKELEFVRRDGIGVNRGESVVGVAAVAAGIREGSGKLAAAISVAGPEERMKPELHAIGKEVQATARAISAALGYRPAEIDQTPRK